jgi:hypothetical protein
MNLQTTLSGNQLTVTGITGGLIGPGWTERSGSISNLVSQAPWYIVNQVSGTTGGNGVYTLSHSGSGSGTVTSAALMFHHTPMSTVKNAFSYTPATVNDYAYDLIQLDAPFVWDGVSNVVVDYCFSGRGTTQPTLRTLTAGSSARRATSSTVSTRCSSDPTSTSSGSNQIAEIGFQFQSTSCTAPTQNADSLRALSVTSTTASLNWIGGNGAGRVVYINTTNKKALQGEKIETPTYITEQKLKIDYSFYITNQIMKPVQQLFALVLEKIWLMQNKMPKISKFKKDVELLRKNTDPEKFEDKLEQMRNKEVKVLLFDEYLRETNNEKAGNQSVTKFFKK